MRPPTIYPLAYSLRCRVLLCRHSIPFTYAGRSSCCAGLDQINIEIPADAPACFVPLAVRVNGNVSNVVTLNVARAGKGVRRHVFGSSSGVPQSSSAVRNDAVTYATRDVLRQEISPLDPLRFDARPHAAGRHCLVTRGRPGRSEVFRYEDLHRAADGQ
ncbi:MAG: hypothetical protein R2724_17610 [Bryobacterales bacterium]